MNCFQPFTFKIYLRRYSQARGAGSAAAGPGRGAPTDRTPGATERHHAGVVYRDTLFAHSVPVYSPTTETDRAAQVESDKIVWGKSSIRLFAHSAPVHIRLCNQWMVAWLE
jgi:hypothetical protein